MILIILTHKTIFNNSEEVKFQTMTSLISSGILNSSTPLLSELSDIRSEGPILTSPNSNQKESLGILKNKLRSWKKKSTRNDQFYTGLIGFDWTNPLFKGTFIHGHSESIDRFKHKLTEYILVANSGKS